MRNEKAEQIIKNKKIIEIMKAEINRLRNISIDIRTGLKKLEEAVGVISYCRPDLIKMEENIQKLTKKNLVDTTVQTCNEIISIQVTKE